MNEGNDAHYAERAARLLRAGRGTVGSRADAQPEAVIAALASAIRGSARKRKLRAWAVGGGLAIGSAAAAAVLSLGAHRGATDAVVRGPAPAGPSRPAAPSGFTIAGPNAAPVAPGETLATRVETVELGAADGTSLRVAPQSEMTLLRADAIRWFQLHKGSVEAHVTKLAEGARFVIATPDRQVEVRGTRFRVALASADVDCGGGTVTRVEVQEGVVTVRAFGSPEERVAAGGVWPAGCAPPAPLVPVPAPAAPVPGASRPSPKRRHASAPPVPPVAAVAVPPASSTLAAENDLFAAAARADRAGDSAAALRALDELVTRYPASPLRGPAEAERARLLGHGAPRPLPPAPASP